MHLKETCFFKALLLVLVSIGLTTGLPGDLADLDHHDHDSDSDESYYVDPAKASHMLRIRKFGAAAQIVGGRNAIEGEAPYQLSLLRQRKHICGATLILSPFSQSTQIAITAAHCVCKKKSNEPNDPKEYCIRGGSLNKYAGQTLYIRSFKVHEEYDGRFLNDVALIFMEGQFKLGRNLDTLDLPEQYMEQPGFLTVTGWGTVRENGQSVTDLQIVGLPVIDNEECAALYRVKYPVLRVIHFSSICTLVPKGGTDACKISV